MILVEINESQLKLSVEGEGSSLLAEACTFVNGLCNVLSNGDKRASIATQRTIALALLQYAAEEEKNHVN